MRAAGAGGGGVGGGVSNASPNPLTNKHLEATGAAPNPTTGNNMPTPHYRRPSLIEATGGSNALGPSHFPTPPQLRGSPTRFGGAPRASPPSGFTPGGVRSGRTVTWTNPAHNPDFSVI